MDRRTRRPAHVERTATNARRALGSVAALAVAVIIGGCGPGGQVDPPVGPTPTGPVSATVTPDGGSVRAVSDEGAVLDVAFPAGAVDSDILVTVTPLAIAPEVLARFAVEPPGLVLLQPAAVTLQLPAGSTSSDEATLALEVPGEPTVVPSTRSADGRAFAAALRFFAFPTVEVLERLDADDDHVADQIALFEARCQEEIDLAAETLARYVQSNWLDDALRLIMRVGFLLDRCARYAEFEAWLEQAETIVCARYDDMVLVATAIAADTFKTFKQVMTPVTHWYASVQAFGGPCETPTAVEVFEAKYPQLITFLAARINGLQFTAEYEDIMDEARRLMRLRGMAETLGADAVVGLLEAKVIVPIMNLLRQRAYAECVATSDHYLQSGLFEARLRQRRVPLVSQPPGSQGSTSTAVWRDHGAFEDADLERDVQYCGTSVDLEVWSGGGVPTSFDAEARSVGGPTVPGGETTQVSSRAPREGYLTLRPDIDVFRCGQARTLDSQSLVVHFAGNEVHRAASSGGAMPSQPIELDLDDLLSGSDPKLKTTRTVEIVREAGACSGEYGVSPFTLFTWQVELDPAPTLESAAASSAVLKAGQVTSLTFTLPFEDQGANLTTLITEVALAGAVFVRLEDDVASAPSTSGFAGETHGAGTFTDDVHIGCTESGKNPLSFRFLLVDAFEQESAAVTTDLTVDYSDCP